MNIRKVPVVLHVEDDLDQILLMEKAVAKTDLRVDLRVARDGDEAIAYLSGRGAYADRRQYPLPSLILLEIKLPTQPGLEVLEWVRAQRRLKRVGVVILTSSTRPSDVTRAYQLGANSYLVKPESLDGLVDMIGSIGKWWAKLNRFPHSAPASRTFLGTRKRSQKRRILLVDDDRDLREALAETLEELGFDVVQGANGHEAFRYLERNPAVSLILLDMKMPKMDGWQFRDAQRRDEVLRSIPVIAMSAFDDEVKERPIDSDAYLTKPLNTDVLTKAVQSYCL